MPTAPTRSTETGPFRIDPEGSGIRRLLRPTLERVLVFPELNNIYAAINAQDEQISFGERALNTLNITYQVDSSELNRIPKAGPLVVVANHPFGGVDGLILDSILHRVRPDVRLLVNRELQIIPDFQKTCFFVDIDGAPSENLAAMRTAIQWVKSGGVLNVFPSGEVAHLSLSSRGVTEGPWNRAVASIVRMSGATVLPVFFDGRNSNTFQLLGLVHPRLRTLMLPREVLKKKRSRVQVTIGNLIARDRLNGFPSDGELVSYLRARTLILRGRRAGRTSSKNAWTIEDRKLHAVDPPQPPEQLAKEVGRLASTQRLCSSGAFSVYFTRAQQAPSIVQEIGRLRELTFRVVGEGTGTACDLDRFDEHYLHVFVWNEEHRNVVGSYRMGPTDEILPAMGAAGLYTSTLFHYRSRLLEQLNPALELGRSFVRCEYQKDYAPLMILWKGIAQFIADHPRYKTLIGPVSISGSYQSLSKVVLMAFLHANNYLPELARLITPKHPPRFGPQRDTEYLDSTVVRDIDQVGELLAEIEADRHSVPVLLRQYLKLNAKLLGFNVDPQFGDVLDALMMADLTTVNRVMLVRYMGRANAERFLAFHDESLR